jgi:hypothetical protein
VRSKSTRAAAQQSDEALHGDEALGHRVYGKEEALERDRAQQRWSSRGDKAWGGDLLTIKLQPYLCHRPNFTPPSGSHDCLLAAWHDAQTVGEIARNHEECGAAVNASNSTCSVRPSGPVRRAGTRNSPIGRSCLQTASTSDVLYIRSTLVGFSNCTVTTP